MPPEDEKKKDAGKLAKKKIQGTDLGVRPETSGAKAKLGTSSITQCHLTK